MVGQFIDTFWRKSFIGELRRATKLTDDDTQWSIIYHGKEHLFQFVWLQGICVKIEQTGHGMIIEDATGQAEIRGCSRVANARLCSEGDVVIIAGRLLTANLSDRIVIDAYKIESLKTYSPHELNWPYEVIDISQRVYHHAI